MIRLDGVWRSFGRRTALAPITLAVSAGEVVALVGPNGAGKSTALRILAGVIAPSGGSASIAGHDVVTDATAARGYLGYLSQRLGVPPTTVVGDLAALVAAARGLTADEAFAALDAAGLADRAGAALGELSGGQRQRVLLALATLGSVSALVLDEPAISLDMEGAEDVRGAIRRARERGAAVLFASHHLHDVAALADRIVVMVDGHATAEGSLPELAHAAGVPWSPAAVDAPIERIYRILVGRGRAPPRAAARLQVVRGDAA